MARGKSKSKTKGKAKKAQPSRLAAFIKRAAQRSAGPVLKVMFVGVVVAAGWVGLERMDRWVRSEPQFAGPPRIVLVDVPDSIADQIYDRLRMFENVPWSQESLCRRMTEVLEADPWVAEVIAVKRLPDRIVQVDCEYRMPFAMVQTPTGFVLVDAEGVRLPGVYQYHPSYMLIQGVAASPPPPGQAWEAGSVRSGLGLIDLLDREPYSDQITAVLVHNYGGRQDRSAAQLELATDRAGGRIIWGSAVGDELEENTAAEKLELLRANYERFGRADANRSVIDVSVLPDRTYVPT